MTVLIATYQVEHTPNGATTEFAFTFPVPDSDELDVSMVDSGGTLITAYTVGDDYTLDNNYPTAGGTVTFLVAPTLATAGDKVRITRTVDMTQLLDLPNQSGFYPEEVMRALDRIVIMIQQLDVRITALEA